METTRTFEASRLTHDVASGSGSASSAKPSRRSRRLALSEGALRGLNNGPDTDNGEEYCATCWHGHVLLRGLEPAVNAEPGLWRIAPQETRLPTAEGADCADCGLMVLPPVLQAESSPRPLASNNRRNAPSPLPAAEPVDFSSFFFLLDVEQLLGAERRRDSRSAKPTASAVTGIIIGSVGARSSIFCKERYPSQIKKLFYAHGWELLTCNLYNA